MIIFYISETLRSIRHSKLASFITIISLVIAILATSMSITLLLLSSKIDDELKERVELDIFLLKETNQKEVNCGMINGYNL